MSSVSLPMILALITCPALLATNEAIRQGQAKDRKEEHRARRCNLVVRCSSPSSRSREIDHRQVVLKNSKLYINLGRTDGASSGYPFTGYYLPYPDTSYEGLVSSISPSVPAVMNWIYVDRTTYEVKYGVRANAQENITGPFDCTRQDHRLMLESWEGFVAVEEDGEWSLYFDRDDDGLRGKLGDRVLVLEVELCRWEIRIAKDG